MARKGENIYKRKDGRWEGRYPKKRNSSGNIVYGYIYASRYQVVKTELTKKRAEYLNLYQNFDIYDGTVAEWMNYWLSVTMKNKIKQTTFSAYKRKMERHIFPYLGKIKLNELTIEKIEELVQYLLINKYAPATVHGVINILKSALKKATIDKKISRNPCDHLLLPPLDKKAIVVLTKNEQVQLEKLVMQEKKCSPVILALYTGMRIGEISGLEWQDIDFEHDIIHIRRTVSRIPVDKGEAKTKIIIDKPKTKSSLRDIPLSSNLKKYLKKMKSQQDGNYVVSCRGSFMEPRIINYHFKKSLKSVNISDIHFHSLRHTFATRCVEAGVDIASLSKIMGHASMKMTLDTYTTALWETRIAAIQLIDKQLQV